VKVRAPFTIDHGPTRFMLGCLTGDIERWHLTQPDDYLRYLTLMWDQGDTFVNIEHDVEFEPGVVSDLWDCPYAWCWAPYAGVSEPQLPHLGMTKLSRDFIVQTHDVWKDFLDDSTVMRQRWQRQPTWSMLDGWLYRYTQRLGILSHRHRTTVVNARPDGVEQMRDDSMAGFLHG
jgi:hypothetical protein